MGITNQHEIYNFHFARYFKIRVTNSCQIRIIKNPEIRGGRNNETITHKQNAIIYKLDTKISRNENYK